MKTSLSTSGQSAARRRGQAAFSLVEVTVGLGIVGTCVAALFSGFTTGFFTIRMARENLRATQILLQKTETLRLLSWDQLTGTNTVPTVFTERYDPNAPTDKGIMYSGTIDITTCPITASYSNEMKMVVVSVNWKTGAMDRNRSYTTYVSRYGLQNYIY
jgi:type II secretory pathway pseudopilin PulG